MKITDTQRSMIATAFVAAYDYAAGPGGNQRRSLCCSTDAINACARIVGASNAEKLHEFFYEELGCCGWRDDGVQRDREQHFLDKISALDAL